MTDGSSRELTFYPALYFDASPTYNAWVKLTVAAVHCLESRKGFEGKYDVLGRRYHAYLQTGQGIYFYGNHPISFVVVAGMVVDFEPNSVYWLFHIDDGSGSLVEVVLPRPRESPRALASPGQPIGPISPATVGISGYGSRIDVGGIEVGKCVKVSGTIREFRGIKQVSLEKLGTKCALEGFGELSTLC